MSYDTIFYAAQNFRLLCGKNKQTNKKHKIPKSSQVKSVYVYVYVYCVSMSIYNYIYL